jgi:cytochrome b561
MANRVSQRLVRLLFATILLLAARPCFAAAQRSLSQIYRPHDLFGLSLLTASLLACLLLAAFVACLLPGQEDPPTIRNQHWVFYLSIAAIALILSATVIATDTPTSFVSWEQVRGVPLPWLQNAHFWGPCFSDGRPCRTYWLLSVRPLPLFANFGVMVVALHSLRRLTTRWSRPGQLRGIGSKIGRKSWPGGSSRGR